MSTSDTGLSLLRAILANRANDGLREVYADYLEFDAEPREPERAEFIRVQCELARTKREGCCDSMGNGLLIDGQAKIIGVTPCECEWAELRRRERELLEAHEYTWLCGSNLEHGPQVTVAARPGLMKYRKVESWTRGFVSTIAVPWDFWLAHVDAILARQPIERVKLATMPHRGVTNEMIMKRWPGIAFELPPEQDIWFMSQVSDPTNFDYAPMAEGTAE